MKSLHDFLHLLAQAPRWRVGALILLMVLASLTEGVGLLLLVPLLETLGGGSSQHAVIQKLLAVLAFIGISPTLGGLLTTFLGLIAFRSGVQYARERVATSLQLQLVDRLRLECFTALMGAEWRWLLGTRHSDHANLLLTDVSRIGVGLNFGLSLLASLATLLAYLLVAFSLSWSMTGLALLSGGIVFWLLSGLRRKALHLGQSLTWANRNLHGTVQESLAGIKLAKILGCEARRLDHFARTLARVREEKLAFVASSGLSRALFQFGGAALLAAYLFVGLRLWHTPLPELLTLVLTFSRLIPLLMSSQQQLSYWLHALPALDEANRLLAECRTAGEPDTSAGPLSETRPPTRSICLRDVSLMHAERELPALAGVSLCLPVSTTTAVMGASGAGKSTLADLLTGLLVPDAGVLEVDGLTVTGAARKAWRRQVAYVPQEVYLFPDTIRNNLLWGRPGASEPELQRALERAAAQFAFSLPKGLDTEIGDAGVRLSGGERQRIALARALLRKPSLLILDEATSALDRENEARIREAIEQLHGDLTVVIIGHRLATLEHADQVIVLDAGHIVSQGTWTEIEQTPGGFL